MKEKLKKWLSTPNVMVWVRVAAWFLMVMFMFAVIALLQDMYEVDKAPHVYTEPVTETTNDSISFADSVYTYIFTLRLEHPDIVMAQCIEESGSFASPLFKQGNNCTGMKVPSQRPTLAVGVLYGHARFNSWKDCLNDYALWQCIYGRGLTKDAYYALLDRVYAEKGGYSNRLKNIIAKRDL